jgi:hypothetical protein
MPISGDGSVCRQASFEKELFAKLDFLWGLRTVMPGRARDSDASQRPQPASIPPSTAKDAPMIQDALSELMNAFMNRAYRRKNRSACGLLLSLADFCASKVSHPNSISRMSIAMSKGSGIFRFSPS